MKLQMKLSKCKHTKTSRDAKRVAEFRKKAPPTQNNIWYQRDASSCKSWVCQSCLPKKYKNDKKFFWMKKCRRPASDHETTQD